jgi:hypothetical protein
MKEGEEALLNFDKVKDHTGWQQKIEWYRVLAFLINRDLDQAKEMAEIIIYGTEDNFRSEATRLLEMLK